jgi:hypothetical protein
MFRLAVTGIVLVAALFILSGCFAAVADQNANAQAKEQLYCDCAGGCEIKWYRALNYVLRRFPAMRPARIQTTDIGPASRASCVNSKPV